MHRMANCGMGNVHSGKQGRVIMNWGMRRMANVTTLCSSTLCILFNIELLLIN
jgi:hypothetical protein